MSDASLRSWIEWKELCALGRCSEGARHELQQFAVVRFQKYANAEAYRTNDPNGYLLRVTPVDAWHLLEVYFTVHFNRQGKRYKDWLFARTELSEDNPLDVIQGGATVLMREAVREFIRREVPAWGHVSLHAPLHDSPGSGTIEDLLPGELDPLGEVESREYEDLAAKHANALLGELDKRERVALAAKGLGRSLADPVVLEYAGCKKSVLNAAYGTLIQRVATQIMGAHPGEERASLRYLTERTLAHLREKILEESPEKPGLRTFLCADRSPVP